MIKADFGEQIEPDMLAFNGDSGDRLHNVYSLLYNRCVYAAAELYGKTGAFLFSRASWTGSQKYPAQWGGDPQAYWGGLAASLRAGGLRDRTANPARPLSGKRAFQTQFNAAPHKATTPCL